MDKQCAVCKQEIDIKNNIYRGFDCTFCSTYCRTKMWTHIYQEDSNFNNPNLWPNKTHKFKKVFKWDNDIKKDENKKESKKVIVYEKSSDSVINYNIYDHIPNDKYYNCNYSIYDMLPIKYISYYLLETIESSFNLFR